MAPTIGRVALDNGFHGSIPGDWVAPPPQNIHGLGIWGAINLLEGYGNDNPGANAHVR